MQQMSFNPTIQRFCLRPSACRNFSASCWSTCDQSKLFCREEDSSKRKSRVGQRITSLTADTGIVLLWAFPAGPCSAAMKMSLLAQGSSGGHSMLDVVFAIPLEIQKPDPAASPFTTTRYLHLARHQLASARGPSGHDLYRSPRTRDE